MNEVPEPIVTQPAEQPAHNIDLSGYAALLDATYRMMGDEYRGDFHNRLPFCVYQHAMVEYLNVYLIQQQTPYQTINYIAECDFDTAWVPKPISDYVTGLGRVRSPTGDDVRLNLPLVALPRPPIVALGLAAGSFGAVTADAHNVYECYWSPLVTRRLIQRTIEANVGDRTGTTILFGPWQPLADGAYPMDAVATPNLLGYHLPQRLGIYAVEWLQTLRFNEDHPLLHSKECLARTTEVLGELRTLISVPAQFESRANESVFLFKRNLELVVPVARISDAVGTIASPFAADARTFEQANCFAYKRERSAAAMGPCYVSLNGTELAGWMQHRNDNFEMAGVFAPTDGMVDRPWMRQPMHRASPVWDWLVREFRAEAKEE